VLRLADVPLLPGVAAMAKAGVRTGASPRNWDSYGAEVRWAHEPGGWARDLLTDPQTSGGLMAAVAPDAAEAVLAQVRAAGFTQAAVVGEVVDGAGIEVRS
jgi:selenide, water dikinase